MARTQAVYYRDKHGAEPVNEFIEALPAKRAAKIDDYVEEYLNGRPPEAPPPELHAIEKNTGAIDKSDADLAKRRMADFKRRMDAGKRVPPRAAGKDAPPGSRRSG
jgi:hypothetical protein